MANCKFMGVTVDFNKVDDLRAAAMQDDTVAALSAASDAAMRRLTAAHDAANKVWGKPMADFDAAHAAVDAAAAAHTDANRMATDAMRSVVQRLVARDILRALHARRAAV
jgi:hypothetical protein